MIQENGARVDLSLESKGDSEDHTIRYRLEVIAGTDVWSGEAEVVGDKGETVVNVASRLPGWIDKLIRALLRSAWRAREAGAPWPRRIRRWRARPGEAP